MKTYKLIIGGMDMLAAGMALVLAVKKKQPLNYGIAAGLALLGTFNLLDAAKEDDYPDIYGGRV